MLTINFSQIAALILCILMLLGAVAMTPTMVVVTLLVFASNLSITVR